MAALAAFIPDVADLPRHIRADGIGVRYHRPAAIQQEGCLPIRALVYPQYSQYDGTRLAPLPPLDRTWPLEVREAHASLKTYLGRERRQ